MFFLGEIEHRFGSVDSFSRYYRVIAQSKDSAWRILDKLASAGSIGPYPAMYPVKGSYVGDAGHLVIVDAIREMDAVAFYSRALEGFPLHTDGSAEPPEDFPEYVKDIARRLGRSLVNRETKVEQSVLLQAISVAIGETDWQKLRTKFAGVTEPVFSRPDEPAAQPGVKGPESLLGVSGGTDIAAALAVAREMSSSLASETDTPAQVVLTDGEPLPASRRVSIEGYDTLEKAAWSHKRQIPYAHEGRDWRITNYIRLDKMWYQTEDRALIDLQPWRDVTDEEIEFSRLREAFAQLQPKEQSATFVMLLENCKVAAGALGMQADKLSVRYDKPAFLIGTNADGNLVGAGRSVRWLDLNEALEQVKVRHPDIFIHSGGGHGWGTVTLKPGAFETFKGAFELVTGELLRK
jgi:hypothetical protein